MPALAALLGSPIAAAPAPGPAEGPLFGEAWLLFGTLTLLLVVFVLLIVVLTLARRRRMRGRPVTRRPATLPDAWAEAGRRARSFPPRRKK